MIAKMKSLKAFGRNSPPACRLSPRPVPKTPPSASARRPWTVWKPIPADRPTGRAAPDAVELVAAHEPGPRAGTRRQRHRDQVDEVRPGDEEHRERGEREDDGRAEVRLPQDEQTTGTTITRNGIVPVRCRGRPCRASRTSGRGRRPGRASRTRPGGRPAAGRSAASARSRPPRCRSAARNTSRRRDERDDEQRHGGDAEPAVVDPHHHDHGDEPEGGPQDLRAHDRERVVPLSGRT